MEGGAHAYGTCDASVLFQIAVPPLFRFLFQHKNLINGGRPATRKVYFNIFVGVDFNFLVAAQSVIFVLQFLASPHVKGRSGFCKGDMERSRKSELCIILSTEHRL